MRRWWIVAFLVVGVSCRRGPAWLSQAPLIGYRYTDDVGFSGYLPQPPRRVAVLTPAALGLWKAANIPTITLTGCTSLGDDYQTFYLACDDPSALIDALYKAKVEWIWSDPTYTWPETPRPPAPLYYFHPKSLRDWLRALHFLGEVYDAPLLRQTADSLQKEVDTLLSRLARERQFRVLPIGFADSVVLYAEAHPLGQLVREAGGLPPSGKSPLLSPKVLKDSAFLPDIIILPAEKPEIINILLLEVPELYNSPAILHRRVFSMPRELMEAPFLSPLEAFYTLGRILHPEVMGSEMAPLPKPPKQIEE